METSRNFLQKVSEALVSDTFFVPVIGAEIEFYLPDYESDTILTEIAEHCAVLDLCDVTKEKGCGQYEVSLNHSRDVLTIADRILQCRRLITQLAAGWGAHADFSAKPFANDYGNALHIHISLLDQSTKSIFSKEGEEESQNMRYAIGGLLATMQENMPHFAPYDRCYERLIAGYDAPSTISWGGNNRSVALRLPTTTNEPHNRRIEHRVAAADADPYAVITAIISGIHQGITHKILPQSDKIYGDASLEIYGLPKLRQNS